MIELAGGQKRLGVCLDSCHLFASGYDVRTRESLGKVIDEFDKVVGCDRLGALHVNDSMTGAGFEPRPPHQPRRRRDRRRGHDRLPLASRASRACP